MSHFYGVVKGQAGEGTRRGSKDSGLQVVAASYKGAIEVTTGYNEDGDDWFTIHQKPWHGAGINELIATGIIGEPAMKKTSKELEGQTGKAQLEGHNILSEIVKLWKTLPVNLSEPRVARFADVMGQAKKLIEGVRS